MRPDLFFPKVYIISVYTVSRWKPLVSFPNSVFLSMGSGGVAILFPLQTAPLVTRSKEIFPAYRQIRTTYI